MALASKHETVFFSDLKLASCVFGNQFELVSCIDGLLDKGFAVYMTQRRRRAIP